MNNRIFKYKPYIHGNPLPIRKREYSDARTNFQPKQCALYRIPPNHKSAHCNYANPQSWLQTAVYPLNSAWLETHTLMLVGLLFDVQRMPGGCFD